MSNVLHSEPFINSTLRYFLRRLDETHIRQGKVCEIDRWVHYCTYPLKFFLMTKR